MKTLLNFGIIGSSFAILILVLATSQYSAFGQLNSTDSTSTNVIQNQPQAQEPQLQPFTITREEQVEDTGATSNSGIITTNTVEDDKNDDIVLLSQRYNRESFSDEIVGEVLNNGSEAAEFVKVSASFYDSNGAIIGSESTYAEPSTIRPGERAAFTIMIFDNEAIEDDTERYEFTIEWRDGDFNQFSNRVTGEQAGDNDNNNDNDNDNNNNDNNNNDNNNNDNDNDNDNDNNDNDNDNDNNNNDNDEDDVEDSVRETVSESGINFNFD